jgi:hypothetical protein
MIEFKPKYKSEYNKINSTNEFKCEKKMINDYKNELRYIGASYFINSDRNRKKDDVYRRVVTWTNEA